jgi:hypothetical protein
VHADASLFLRYPQVYFSLNTLSQSNTFAINIIKLAKFHLTTNASKTKGQIKRYFMSLGIHNQCAEACAGMTL